MYLRLHVFLSHHYLSPFHLTVLQHLPPSSCLKSLSSNPHMACFFLIQISAPHNFQEAFLTFQSTAASGYSTISICLFFLDNGCNNLIFLYLPVYSLYPTHQNVSFLSAKGSSSLLPAMSVLHDIL